MRLKIISVTFKNFIKQLRTLSSVLYLNKPCNGSYLNAFLLFDS